jgi:hypothetical protein
MANPEKPSEGRRPGSIEQHGVGQSGYTAGRRQDAALDRGVDTRHVEQGDEPPNELGTDDRFTGRGGTVLKPKPVQKEDDERAPDSDEQEPAPDAPDED